MGGKKQQSQRSKNNTKPSNSGRSAEHITTVPAAANPSFSTFKSNQFQTTKFTAAQPELIDAHLEPSFIIAFKKMNKKDPITRYKALQEFINLCNTSDVNIVNDALPTWVRIYANLVVDVEHRIREAAQNAHHAIVTKVGRNLAPFIKQIAPLWFISQYDTHAPAASAASRAFKEAFPPHKIVDVITFCQGEILQYISENLMAKAPITGKAENKQLEEIEAKYERIVVCCLNGYALFLSKIPSDRLDTVKAINDDIISNVNFWKFSKYKAGPVRAAWFSLLSTMCQQAPFLLENEQKRAINSALTNMNDYDPIVLPAAWEASLQIVTNFQDCWHHINMDKFFLPKLVNIINHGGQGNASFIFPNVLPLLSRIPESKINNKQDFFVKIFNAFLTGFKQQSILQSHTESEAIAISFNECIRYLILKHAENLDFCLSLLDIIMNAISTTMVNPAHRYLITPLYTSLTQTLLHWKKNETNNPSYQNLSQEFWKQLITICTQNIDNNIYDKLILNFVYNCHYKLVTVLNEPCIKKKKKMKVQFVTDTKETKKPEETENLNETISKTEIKIQLSNFLTQLGSNYFSTIMKDTNTDFKICTVEHLHNISNNLPKDQVEKLITGVIQDIPDVILNWLNDSQIPTNFIIGFVFNSVDYIDEDKKNFVLSSLLKVRSEEALQDAMKIAIYSDTKPVLTQWLNSESVQNEICNLLQNSEKQTSPVFQYCLSMNKNKFILGDETVAKVFDILGEMLAKGSVTLENANTIMNPLFTIRNEYNIEALSEKIIQMLELIFKTMVVQKNFNSSNAWNSGIVLFSSSVNYQNLFSNHLHNCAKLISDYLNNEAEQDSDVNGAVKASFMLLNAIDVDEDEINTNVTICKLFLSTILNNSIQYRQNIETICQTVEFLDGNLPYNNDSKENSLHIKKSKWDPLVDIKFTSYVWSLVYSLKYLTILMDANFGNGNPDDEQVFEHLHFQLTDDQYHEIIEYIIQLCYGFRLCECIINSFSNTKPFYNTQNQILEMKRNLIELVQRLKSEHHNIILSTCQERFENGKFPTWFQTYKIIKYEFLDHDSEPIENDNESLNEDFTSENLFWIRQNIAKKRDFEKLKSALDIIYIQCKKDPIKELKELSGSHLCYYSEISWFLSHIIKYVPDIIDKEKSDFILISLATWIERIHLSHSHKYSLEFVRFVTSVCDLHQEFIAYLSSQDNDLLLDEWNSVFAIDAYNYMGKLWKNKAEKTLDSNFDHISLKYLKTLTKMICFITDESDTCQNYWSNKVNASKWLQYAADCITSPYIPVQITSYRIILKIIPALVQMDSSCDERNLSKLSCQKLLSKMTETRSIVSALLHDYGYNVSCSVSPCSDSFTYTWVYTLIWSLVLKLCQKADSQTLYLYTLWINEQELIKHFMENIVKLMPESVLLNTNVSKNKDLFVSPPNLTQGCLTSESLSQFCCWLYCDLLRTLPALVRQWCAEAEPKFLSFIDKLTVTYVSSIICNEEIKAVKEQQKACENMTVQTYPSAREVVAMYTVEESTMELTFKLATNHPLSPPKVEISKGLTSANQSKFIMQLSIFVTRQNGSIWDGLMLWKNNLDKKFEGIEECYICFSILNSTTNQLPKLSCQNCRKKFHSYCLYRWFTTSNKSTCPICRSHF